MTLGNFSQRVVNAWNGLSQFVVAADMVNSFQNGLKKFDRYYMEGNWNCGKTGCQQADYGLLSQYEQADYGLVSQYEQVKLS